MVAAEAGTASTGVTDAEAEALAAASRAGAPVEVRDAKTESSRVLATPQGSLVLESYAVPRWTKRSGGAWQQIDMSLQTTPERGVVPAATLADVSFSAGGPGPVVRLPVAGGEVSLAWLAALPVPRLDGDSAVYESVLPGVDLRLRTLIDGFTWVLVVKSAEAAANPALDELRFRLDTPGLTARERAGGGFEVVDGSGATVLSSGNALMWDSSGVTTSAVAAKSRALARSAEQVEDEVVETIPDLARKAELVPDVQGSDLVIRPDSSLLRGVDTIYPVVIDPWTTISKLYWGYSNTSNATRDDGVARVGNNPDGSGVYRSYFSFNLGTLSGKTIRSAKFLTTMTHSWSCTSTSVNLWRTADMTSGGKKAWSGPSFSLWIEQQYGHAHKPSGGAGCSNDPQPDMPMEFASSNLKTDITNNRGQSVYTLALSARQSDGTSESTDEWWKKFAPTQTKLSVEYNTAPNTPAAAQMSTHADYTAPAQACITGTSRPSVRSAYPWLKATLTDPDGSNGGSLSGTFTLQKDVGGVWTTVTGWPKTDSGVSPGAKAEVQLTTKTVDGEVYRWQVQTKDTLGGVSGWSTWCEFRVDYSAPEVQPAVSPADGLYLESPPLGTNQTAQGSPGYTGKFTLSANNVQDVYDYTYQLNGGPVLTATPPMLGGSVTVSVTPNKALENVLTVRSRDLAGNASDPYDYKFLVGNYSAPKAHWAIQEGDGITLANSVAGAPAATLVNGPVWQDGLILGQHANNGKDWAVKFDGVDDHAVATGVALDTTRSYSVAAWVRPDADGLMEIAGATGTETDAFMLRKWTDNRWVFTVIEQDLGTSAFTNIYGPVAVNGQWTHVAGVYDQAGGIMRLYVNGVEVASGTVARTFNAGGQITIGRERWQSTDVCYWNGAIGGVRLWDRVINPDVDILPTLKPALVGRWDMDNSNEEARTEDDVSLYQRPLALTASPSADWTDDGYAFSRGLIVNGSPGSADTSGPVVRTDQSFTVAAWVKVTKAEHQTIVSQDGTSRSAFYLMYDIYTNKWCITMPSVDVGTADWQYVLSQNQAQLNTWTHVAATYDAASRELRLYVNGDYQGMRSSTVGWHGSSKLHVGRAINSFFLNGGTVDQVQLWQGRLSDDQILGLLAEG